MTQILTTNIHSLTSQRHQERSQLSLSTLVQRVSSSDHAKNADATGLTVSQRMKARFSGFSAARRNVNDGVTLSQTAENAISNVDGVLRRMRELAVKSADNTLTNSDRLNLNYEAAQLKNTLQRLSADANFNGRKLLDGSFVNQPFQIGNDARQMTILSLADSRPNALGIAAAPEISVFSFANNQMPAQGETYAFDLNGVRVNVMQSSATGNYTNFKEAINMVALQTHVVADFAIEGDPKSGLQLKGVSSHADNFARYNQNNAQMLQLSELPTVAKQLAPVFPYPPMSTLALCGNNIDAQTLSLEGDNGEEIINVEANESAKAVAEHVNRVSQRTGIIANAHTVAYLSDLTGDGHVSFTLYGAHEAGIKVSADVKADDLSNLATAINTVSKHTGIDAKLSDDKRSIQLMNDEGYDIGIEGFKTSNTNSSQQSILFKSPAAMSSEATDNANTRVLDSYLMTQRIAYLSADPDFGYPFGFEIYTANGESLHVPVADASPENLRAAAALINQNSRNTRVSAEYREGEGIKLVKGDDNNVLIKRITDSENRPFQVRESSAAVQLQSGTQYDSSRISGMITFNGQHNFHLETTDALAIVGGGSLMANATLDSNWLAVSDIDLSSVESATIARNILDGALEQVGANRAKLAALHKRFEKALSNVDTTAKKMTTEIAKITDSKTAAESVANLSKQIVEQGGLAMLAQGNALPKNVLALLQA